MICKRWLLAALLPFMFCFLAVTKAGAQDFSKMNLHFVYIDHEPTTPVNQLCQKLRILRDDATEIDDALIIYLSDGKSSPMSFTNLKDVTGNKYDQREAFDDVIDALQNANSHDVIAREDRRNILNVLDAYNFIDDAGRLRFASVVIDFYVGPSFWTLGNNEKVISHLFVALNAAAYTRDKFSFYIWKPRGENLGYPEGKPFGDKNIDGINSKVSVFEY